MSLSEERLVDVLREAPLPATPNDLAERMLSDRPRHRRFVRWAVTAGAAAMGAFATVALLLQPTTSLAQVVDASVAAVKVKITNTRSWVPKAADDQGFPTFQIVTYRNGPEWRYEEHFPAGLGPVGYAVCDGRHSVAVRTERDGKKVALIDGAYQVPTMFDTADKLLSPHAKAVVHHNVLWHGKRVDRFDEFWDGKTAQYVDGPGIYRLGTESLEEHIWADPSTHRPLRVQILRLGGAWGDTWDYDYSDQPVSLFSATPPEGSQVIDLSNERARLMSEIPPNGAVLVDPLQNARLVLSPSIWPIGQACKIAVGSLINAYELSSPMRLEGRTMSWSGLGFLGHRQLPKSLDCTVGQAKPVRLPIIKISSLAVLRPFIGAHGVFLR